MSKKKFPTEAIVIALSMFIGIVFFKIILPKTDFLKKDFFKTYNRKTKIISSIDISTTLRSDKLSLLVNNKSQSYFKDLVINCTFDAHSGTVLGEAEYTIYNLFYKRNKHKINNITVSDVPNQTDSLTCDVKDIYVLSKEEVKQLIIKKIPKEKLKKQISNNWKDL